MEKIKNILNPGGKKDDDVLYGSGQSSDPAHSRNNNTGGLSGQGSHFGSSHQGTDPLSSSTDPTSSGVSPGYGSNTIGTGVQPGVTGNTTSRSLMPGGFDDGASTASIKSGVSGYPQSGSGLTGSSGTGDSLDTNKPLPHTPSSGLTGSNPTTGPHSSNIANKADARVDSDLDGSRGVARGTTGSASTSSNLPDRSVPSSGLGTNTGSSHLGRDTAVGTGAVGAAGLAEHERERQGGHATTGTGVGSGTTDSPIGAGSRGYGPDAWEHDHKHHGHQFEGDPCSHGVGEAAGPHFTSGPHATDTANLLDPHVAGGVGTHESATGAGHHGGNHHGTAATGAGIGSTGSGSGLGSTTGTGSGVGSTGSGSGIGGTGTEYKNRGNDGHLGRDAALAGGAGGAGVGAYEAGKHHHGRDEPSQTSGLSGTTAGTSSRDYDSTRGSFAPGSDTQTGSGHHYGRDAGVAGAGAAGGAEFSKHEAEKHHKEEKQAEHHEGKKHGGILGFLHHDKDTKEKHTASGDSHGSHESRHGTEAAGVGAAGAGTAAHEHGKHDHDRSRLHKDPPKGYASQVTGGTGTTTLAEGESIQRGSHATGVGNKLDPNVAARGDSLPPGDAIEPHTGLPINVSKHGSGAGGTDDTPVPGYHTR